MLTFEPRLPKGPQEAHCSPIELGSTPGASKSTVTSLRGLHLSRQNEGELVEEVLWVLDDADHLPRCASDSPGVADLQVEIRCDSSRDGDLVCCRRVVARNEGEHRLAVGAVRVLGPQLVGIDRAGNLQRLVLDDVDLAEAVLQGRRSRRRDGGRSRRRRPCPGRFRTLRSPAGRVGRHRRADDGRGDGHD